MHKQKGLYLDDLDLFVLRNIGQIKVFNSIEQIYSSSK